MVEMTGEWLLGSASDMKDVLDGNIDLIWLRADVPVESSIHIVMLGRGLCNVSALPVHPN